MSGPSMDFETLTKETLELSQNLDFDFERFEDAFLPAEKLPKDSIVDFFSDSHAPEQGPGVVYLLESGLSTFCLRGISTDDLSLEYDLLQKKELSFLKLFRINDCDAEEVDKIAFFATPSKDVADSLVKDFMNRRFPIAETSLCNLSDPGFSWWMNCDESEINIYFQSHSIDRDKMLLQLGPLGEPAFAMKMLQKACSTLMHFFPIKDYSVTSRGVSISCAPEASAEFSEFSRVFTDGEFAWSEILEMGSGPHQEVLLYLQKLAYKRRFWRLVGELS